MTDSRFIEVPGRINHELNFQTTEEVSNFLYKNEIAAEIFDGLKIHHLETVRHLTNVGLIASMMADELGFTPEEKETLIYSAALHDAGKLDIPEAVLAKPGRFTEEEREIIKGHPMAGFNRLKNFPDPIVKWVALNHHREKRRDPYPDGALGHNTFHIPNDLTDAQMNLFQRVNAAVVAADMSEAVIGNRAYQLREGITPRELVEAEKTRREEIFLDFAPGIHNFVAARKCVERIRNRIQGPPPQAKR